MDSTAGVFDRELDALRFGLGRYGNLAAVRREAEGVIEEVTQSPIE